MPTRPLNRTIVVFCLASALVVAYLGCTSTGRLTPGEALILPFIVGPYLFAAAAVRFARCQRTALHVVSILAVAVCLFGLVQFSIDYVRYHKEVGYRMTQRTTVFMTPVIQWPVVLTALGIAIAVRTRVVGRRH
jgi:hypothetical protein